MAGGKGGKSETTVQIPESLEVGAQGVLANALRSAAQPYAPNRGVTIAAFTPQEKAAFRGTNAAAQAFGTGAVANPMAEMPRPERTEGGFRGYSTGDIYDENLMGSTTKGYRKEQQAILDEYARVGKKVKKTPLGKYSGKGGGGKGK